MSPDVVQVSLAGIPTQHAPLVSVRERILRRFTSLAARVVPRIEQLAQPLVQGDLLGAVA